MLIPALLLAAVLVLLAWFVRNDRAEYAAFKALTRTGDRQRVFRRWTIRSFLFFCGCSLVILLLLGRLGALLRPPPEFAPLAARFGHDFSSGFVPAVIAATIGAVGGAVVGARLGRRRADRKKKVVIGDIEPLLPRNSDERRWTALLGAGAGLGEELFFRLMLPLLVALVSGSAVIAFAAAGLVFGLVHFYQGWIGILATTIVGFVLAALYLATGSLWAVVLIHGVMNLNSLWLQPLLAARRSAAEILSREGG